MTEQLALPLVGLGTYHLDEMTTYTMVLNALNLGYRHIDTAALYRNESAIGRALVESSVPRKEIWLTTKIWTTDICKGIDAMRKSIERSLLNLQTDYLDLVLLHNPTNHVETDWRNLETLYQEGKIRYIGVSNYNLADLRKILAVCTVRPFCNQIELSPFLTREELVQFCQQGNIRIVAHSSLTKAHKLQDKTIIELANKYSCSPVTLMLSWARQRGYVVIPRTSKVNHLKENLHHVEIKPEDMTALDNLNENYATHRL